MSPENSPLKRLRYGRIVGTASSGTIQFTTGGGETILIGKDGLGFVLMWIGCDLIELFAPGPSGAAVTCATLGDNGAVGSPRFQVSAGPRMRGAAMDPGTDWLNIPIAEGNSGGGSPREVNVLLRLTSEI